MKYLIALILAFNLTGCMWQTVNHNDIDSAIAICGSYDKVQEIHANWVGGETVVCTNRVEQLMSATIVSKVLK